MGKIQAPHPVKLFAGLLTLASEISKVETVLEKKWGVICAKSESRPFDYSRYYEAEFGPNLVRVFYVFSRNLSPEEIREYKIETNAIELEHAKEGHRLWNIDPGYIDLDKIVLATTKPATYRIYLGEGIYAQSTLFFKDGFFHPWPWTYRDYKEEWALNFFKDARNHFKTELNDRLKTY